MESSKVFSYQWHIDEIEDKSVIRIFGLNERNESVHVVIQDFTPYCYIELPDDVEWTDYLVSCLGKKIDDICKNGKRKFQPIRKTLFYKKKLYYANKIKLKDGSYADKTFPYLMCAFESVEHIRALNYMIKIPLQIRGIGEIKLKMHEHNASPILQLCCLRNIPTAGWIGFKGKRPEDKESTCHHEFVAPWKSLQKCDDIITPSPLIMGFDIEVNSSNPNTMPNSERINDKVFQISCVLARQGDPESRWEKCLLSLGEPDQEIVGDDVSLYLYNTEADLLEGFAEFIQEKNPQIIVGYNNFMFDTPYMIKRAKHFNNLCIFKFDQQGYITGKHAKERLIKWSSSAYGNQQFQFLDAEGRLYVDLLPLVKRDYKFDNFKLSTVSTHFLGESKDPLTPKGIFKCFRIFSPKSLGIVGKYCVQDTNLVVKLFHMMQTWYGLVEMATTCNVPIFYLYTQGQQVKVFSQMYKKCMYENRVVEFEGYIPKEDEKYTGAYVHTPEPGLYDMVVSFDFSSLYPTTIIAYNIDYSTLVIDDSIPDEMCNIFEWEDHQGCEHDTVQRKTKVKNVMCAKRYFRFLKDPKGILPTLLEEFLSARKKTNKEISELKEQLKMITDPDEKIELQKRIDVLDKRQLAYKVSANSGYGAMGVTKGYLPFLPGAMCTTARGRQSIEKASKFIRDHYGGKIIYGDTDSCYVNFPHVTTPQDTWDFCLKVEEEMMTLFPRPMKLAFEEKIYWRFFILTKKRYMALPCDRSGKISNKIFKRGVLLARRDNSKWIRDIYGDLIMKVFYRAPADEVLQFIINGINTLFAGTYDYKNFVITKSVGEIEDYKVRELPEDPKKREKRLKDLGCTEQEYNIRALPAQVQLAEKMRRRGKIVDPGTRLEYVIVDSGKYDDKLFNKMEDIEYYVDHKEHLRLDYFYYLRLAINPFDQLLEVAYKIKEFVKDQHKTRLKSEDLKKRIWAMNAPILEFID